MTVIKKIQLPNGRATTNLGFGCAGILRLPTSRSRGYLLKTAVEEGITHFDVARMYGLGAAEGIVGSSLKSWADQITIATKFGLPYEKPAGFSLKAQSLARWILNFSPALKAGAKKLAGAKVSVSSAHRPANHRNYSIDEMEKSLNLSLQQLQRERVDLFFIHEPGLADLIPEEMCEALQLKKKAGKIGAFGISAGRVEMEHFLKTRRDLCGEAIQYQYSTMTSGPKSHPLQHAFAGMFAVLGQTHPQLCKYLSENKDFTASWSDKLGLELSIHENVGIVILAVALVLNPQGLVLFFTSNPKRLRRIVRQLNDNTFSENSLLEFRQAAIQGIYEN
jgi:aryl-alcohol dehydrogenase-like predicted oxidoreductase